MAWLDPLPQPLTAVVVIGRNEGERLLACLWSLSRQPRPVVYVDSGSADGSAQRARPLCDEVLELDPAPGFSAARARNAGAALALSRWPSLRCLQFVDGDCVLATGWLEAAEAALRVEPGCALVLGELLERRPEASPYNRLCALEWRAPVGALRLPGEIGGLMMVRAEVFSALGGFNERAVAGEDAEFGVRVALHGHVLRRIERPMAIHDADMHRFAQWWRRSVRAGHAIGLRARLHGGGPLRDAARARASTCAWGLALPGLVLALLPGSGGGSLGLLLAYALLGWRVYRHRCRLGDSPADAWLYARFNVLAKFANAWGLLRYQVDAARQRFRLIEYK